MDKTILITGATDGIGLETAKMLVEQGHTVLVHGRNPEKLEAVASSLAALPGGGQVDTYLADLSRMKDVRALGQKVADHHRAIDVLINNAGVLKTPDPITEEGFDIRFAVNTLAPYLLTQRLLPLMGPEGRVINLSSAAQATVDPEALRKARRMSDMDAYAQSKLAITMWSRHLAHTLGADGPVIVAVNPGSLLASKMVKDGFGIAGNDIRIGADILVRAALSEEFAEATGQYYDNDAGRFGAPHPDALDDQKTQAVMTAIDDILKGV